MKNGLYVLIVWTLVGYDVSCQHCYCAPYRLKYPLVCGGETTVDRLTLFTVDKTRDRYDRFDCKFSLRNTFKRHFKVTVYHVAYTKRNSFIKIYDGGVNGTLLKDYEETSGTSIFHEYRTSGDLLTFHISKGFYGFQEPYKIVVAIEPMG